MGAFIRLPALSFLEGLFFPPKFWERLSLRGERFLIEKGPPVYSAVVTGNNPTNPEP